MKPLRIAHISDTHLGYRGGNKHHPESGRNQRSVDVEEAFARVIDDVLTRDVDLILHGGDVFHHTRPVWDAVRAFVVQMRRVERAGIPALVIAGNHDTPRLRSSSSVFSLLTVSLPEIEFVCEYDQRTVEYEQFDLAVTAIPHGQLASPLGATAYPVNDVRNVLLTHGLVDGVRMHGRQTEPGEENVSDALLSEEFDYIGLGHYHVHQKVRHNAWYSGSTERMGWGDEDVTPGYALIELGARGTPPEVTHIPIDVRPMRTLRPPIDATGMTSRDIADEVLGRLRKLDLPDAMARVEIRNADRTTRREAEAILRKEDGELIWNLKVTTPTDVLAPFSERGAREHTDVIALFAEYVENRGYDEQFKSAFAARGRLALERAQQALDNESATEG